GARRIIPAPMRFAAMSWLWRGGFAWERGAPPAGPPPSDAKGKTASGVTPRLSYKYRGWLELADVRDIFREPQVPTAHIDLRGEGAIGGGKASGSGSYSTDNLALYFEDFHAKGLVSRSSYKLDERGAELSDFMAG